MTTGEAGGGATAGGNNAVHDETTDFDYQQSLKNFDLTDYTTLLKELIIWIFLSMFFYLQILKLIVTLFNFFTELVKVFEDRIQNLIVPAILEHEEIASSGMQGQKSIQRFVLKTKKAIYLIFSFY